MARKRRYNRKQAYYNKEYDRLLSQAKKLYNEMSLGGIFGSDLPSFEKILNYAGTKSGLKKPTKESLKALRKLKTESDILWGIEHTLNKKSPDYEENLARLEELKAVREEAEKSVKKAKKDYKKQSETRGKEEQYQEQFNVFSPIETLLSQLRYYDNYCSEKQYVNQRKKGKYANEQVQHFEYAKNSIRRLIADIEAILNSGDKGKIFNLSQGCVRFFVLHPGGVEVEMFYNPNDGQEIRDIIFKDLTQSIEEPKNDEFSDFRNSVDMNDYSFWNPQI